MDRRHFTKQGIKLVGLTLATGVYSQCTKDSVALTRSITLLNDFSTEEVLQHGFLTLSWTSQNISTLQLEISEDDGMNWQMVATGIAAEADSFVWSVGEIHSTIARIRLSDSDDPLTLSSSPSFPILRTIPIDISSHLATLGEGETVTMFKPPLGSLSLELLTDDTFRVLNLECPHNGCEVVFETGPRQFGCPCHGSTFTDAGCLLLGPAEDSLTTYRSFYVGEQGVLLVIASSGVLAC